MKARFVKALAAVSSAASIFLTGASVAISIAYGTGVTRESGAQLTDVLASLGFVPYAAVGALIAVRRPSNRIGLLMCLIGVAMAVTFFAQDYAEWTLVIEPGALPGSSLAHWLSEWPLVIALGSLGAMLLVFPDGKLPSHRWRWIARVGTVGTAMMVVGSSVTPELTQIAAEPNPFTTPFLAKLEVLFVVGFLLLLPATLISAAAPFTRWRRATPGIREQLKWFAFAAVVLAAGAGGLTLAAALGFRAPEAVFDLVLFVGMLAIPIAVGVAVMRYRLFDIDRIVSRTITYALVTALLAGMYGLVTVVVPSLLFGTAETSDLVVALGTLAAAAAFGPVRRRVQNRVDRRFNRARYDAEQTIGTFSSRLREEVDITALVNDLKAVVGSTMHPRYVSLWIREGRRR